MLFHRKRRTMPALNTTSTADISFMLLIFFLVTTSMDQDKGLMRQLPPLNPAQEELTIDMNRSNVLRLVVTADDQLLADDSLLSMGALRQRVVNFVSHCPDLRHHVISLDISRDASYDCFFQLQNEVVAAYRELREQRARRLYGRPMSQCSEQQQSALNAYYPQRVAEIYHTDSEEGGKP